MTSPYSLQHRLAGVLLTILGAFLLFGWTTSNEVMVRVVPGSPAVAINTALMFSLSGICLLTAAKRGVFYYLYISSALILIGLPIAILSQHIFAIDLGVDWSETHAALGDGHANPGRTAPNACLGFFMAGLTFMLHGNGMAKGRHRRIRLVLSVLTLLIGVLALLGYVLHLETMYHLASYNRMAALTAIGMTIVGAGLCSLTNALGITDAQTASAQARRITRLSATLLTVFAVIAGLTGFAVLRPSFEESSAENLHNMAKSNAFIISLELKNGLLVTKSVANRTILKRGISRLGRQPNDREVQQDLHDVGEVFIGSGFSGIQVFDAANELVLNNGTMVADRATVNISLKQLPLGAPQTASLFWKDRFMLRSEQNVIQQGQRIGRVITELPLMNLTQFLVEAQDVGQTFDARLCGREAANVVCFPSRFNKAASRFSMFKLGETPAFSASRALMGEAGSETATDASGTLVQAGFAPLPDYGLGLVVNRDVLELYAPLRDRLHLLIATLIVFVGVGTLLFHNWVQPLVNRIVSEQRRIKAILDNSNDAFIAIGPDGLISDWNLQAEKTLGWTAKEAVDKSLSELIIPADQREAHNRGFSQFLSTGTGPVINQRIEVTAIHKSGDELPVELSVAAFHNGNGYGASAFIRDLTEAKASERQALEYARELELARAALVQSQKLEAVGKLTGGIAHDFNNVLQVVQGSLQLLQLENVNNFQAEKRILTAMTAVDRGAKLSTHLLAFARKQPLQPKVVNVANVIRSMSDMLERALGDAIDVEVIASGGLWNTLVDPNQLENVILNLSINARDAMQGVGKLTVEVSNSMLDEEYVQSEPGLKAGQFVMLAISDTGPGISDEIIERVFEPFFTTKPEGEGTGLGLSMAHGFVKQSEGHIQIYSEVNYGTTVRIYLPRSKEGEDKNSFQSLGNADGGSETILVVEDDSAVQVTVVDILMGLGYKVLKADNADDALEILKEDRTVDVLFTDVVMPGALRSPDLARQAKILIPTLQVLFTSGYTKNALEHGGRLDPGVHLLSKPYGRDQLARKMRELLSCRHIAGSTQDAAPINDTENTTQMKIALVEDNEGSRDALMNMLTLMGYQVESYASAEPALNCFESGQFNVLLTDVSLPGMSGIELASAVYKNNPNIKIILASGYGDGAIANAVDFKYQMLSKPFSVDQLIHCLTNY